MANSIATITRNLTKMIDYVFVADSKTEILENGSKYIDLDFKEAGYVKIYNILMDGLSDYYRANSIQSNDPTIPASALAGQFPTGGSRSTAAYSRYAPEYGLSETGGGRDGFARGSVRGGWELMQLQYYRGKQFVVDQMDNEETAGMIIGNLLTEFVRTKVVPEVDEVRFNRLIEATSGGVGNLVTENIDYDTIIAAGSGGVASVSMISKLNKAFVWAKKHGISTEEQVIFVSADVWGLLLADPMMTRFLDVKSWKGENDVTFEVKTYMGRPIIDVPDDRFFTDPTLGNNGYYTSATSKKINFIVCSLKSIVPVVKLDYMKIWEPSQVQDFIGYKVNFAMYHDAFIPRNKKVSVYASIGSTSAATNVLYPEYVDATSGAAITEDSTAIKVVDYLTMPMGILGSALVYQDATSDPFTIGSNAGVSGATPVTIGSTSINIPSVSTHSLYFALVQNGVVVAKSEAVLTKSS